MLRVYLVQSVYELTWIFGSLVHVFKGTAGSERQTRNDEWWREGASDPEALHFLTHLSYVSGSYGGTIIASSCSRILPAWGNRVWGCGASGWTVAIK